MGKLHKKIKKYSPGASLERAALGEKTFDDVHFLGTSMEKQYDATKAAEAAALAAENEPVMPIADEEALRRARRRSNQRRRNQGRASTILGSDAETLG